MSLWSRIANALRGDRLSREIDEEMQSHIAEAIEQGRDGVEARRAFGPLLRQREESRDIRLVPWLDSLRADAVFGWRQLMKNKAASAAAIVSLALATGACTSAFRLIDALLLRPLPVAHPERLYAVCREGAGLDGKFRKEGAWAYAPFRLMREAVKGQAELLAISYAQRTDVTYKSDQEMERPYLQYVSGGVFHQFGLRPELGRVFTDSDDLKPGAHPYAVLSYDYWKRRFALDPKAVGRTFRMGGRLFEIVGVGPRSFAGTETGIATDIFLPTMMNSGVTESNMMWARILVQMNPGVPRESVRQKLYATSQAFEREQVKGFRGAPSQMIAAILGRTLLLEPAAAGVSEMQQEYRRALVALGVLVGLVLLIACANVANLMTAQAAARAREMALRVAIGAGRGRLLQLVLVESVWLAGLAGGLGWLFAWWSAPFVVSRINPPDAPARLFLPADWRVLGFSFALTIGVIFLFGLAPALRASAVKPASVLRGGSAPHSRRRLMHALIAVQVAFCFLVLFVAGLFAATFNRLSNRPTGFSVERLLTLTTVAQRPLSPVYWDQAAEHLRTTPGVQTVALAEWPLLGGQARIGFVSIAPAPPSPITVYSLAVSPDWLNTMGIPLIDGRTFAERDTSPGVAIVNETFVAQFFEGQRPIGRTFALGSERYEVVGVARDAPYRSLREPNVPVAYFPFHPADTNRTIRQATFIVRTSSANPLSLAPRLRQEVPRARGDFRVSNTRTQEELVRAQSVRERLLAMLALFFAMVALLLAGVGLYGVLDYSVQQQRREIGIRMAIGAQAGDVAWRVTVDVFLMVLVGALAGLTLGMASVQYIAPLLYKVQPTDFASLALPSLTILAAALVAALPAVIRAVRIDPVQMLRAE